jgi:hypothetical protein
MNDKDKAEAYRMVADYLHHEGYDGVADNVRARADELDPPKVDRSLRGWVVVRPSEQGGAFIRWAGSYGLYEGSENRGASTSWERVEYYGWTVRPLTAADLSVEAYTVEEIRQAFMEAMGKGGSYNDVLTRLRANWEAKR